MSVLTPSGVPGIGEIEWGSHFCHFYDSAHDLDDTLVPFFRAGLENNEACLWVTSEPYTSDDARRSLRTVVPDLTERERSGQIEIIDHASWYVKTGKRDARATLDGWLDREAKALQGGYRGLRLTGNTYWLQRPDWDSFIEYETLVNEAFRPQRIVALCSYCLHRCTPHDVLDVVRNHQFTVSRRKGEWEVLESAALKLARRDLLRLQESERSLQEADRRKDEFIAMLAHELRNPLAPIRTGIDILALESSDHREILELMQTQVKHLVRLVDELLEVSRVMRGKIELRREPIELATVIRRSVETVQPMIEKSQQELAISMPGTTVWLHADPVRIVQVVSNLLNNASKYTPRHGRIEVEAAVAGEMAAITVRDNGIGMEPELLPRVFELFLQGNLSIDRSQGGLGIGLTLVRRLIEMHGGSVVAQSAGPGKGSQFTITVPLGRPEPQQVSLSAAPQLTAARRVLVVDDNSDAARMLSLLLRRIGPHQVEIAADGGSALSLVEQFRPDVVLLDIGLPQMDGYEVAKRIRNQCGLDDLLLVAVTGYGQEEDRLRTKKAGFDEHIIKPVALERLVHVLSHSKLARER